MRRTIEAMWLRRGFFGWLFPAAILLPLWLLVGWAVFNPSGWTFLGVLFIAGPAVLIGELVIALLIRARPTVRARRAVSWRDLLGVSVWHVLVIAYGCYPHAVFVPILVLAIVAFLALFWSSVALLVQELRVTAERYLNATGESTTTSAPASGNTPPYPGRRPDVYVINESSPSVPRS
jgi:hypothetical protein